MARIRENTVSFLSCDIRRRTMNHISKLSRYGSHLEVTSAWTISRSLLGTEHIWESSRHELHFEVIKDHTVDTFVAIGNKWEWSGIFYKRKKWKSEINLHGSIFSHSIAITKTIFSYREIFERLTDIIGNRAEIWGSCRRHRWWETHWWASIYIRWLAYNL